MILHGRNADNSIHIGKFRLCKSAKKNCSEAGSYYSCLACPAGAVSPLLLLPLWFPGHGQARIVPPRRGGAAMRQVEAQGGEIADQNVNASGSPM